MADLDVFDMAEGGEEALERLIDQGPPKAAKRGRPGDPKAAWRQTNIRMAPDVKRRLKSAARALGVPIEELIHVALLPFLDRLESGELELEPRETVTRKTLLPGD